MNSNSLNKIKLAFPKDQKLSGMRVKYWLKTHPDIEKEVIELLEKNPNILSTTNVIACLINDIDLNSLRCKVCGKPVRVAHITYIPRFCSTKCGMNADEVQNKRKQTISLDEHYYENIQKKKVETCLKKYGVDVAAKAESVKEKAKQTIAKDPLHWEKRNKKTEETNLKKYGVKNSYNIASIAKKSQLTKKEKLYNGLLKYKNKFELNFSKEYFINSDIHNSNLSYICKICKKEFFYNFGNNKILINSIKPKNIPYCPYCTSIKKHSQSNNELEILEFIRSIYKGKILESSNKIITPYELDIVILEKNFAIEYNGIYWHSLYANRDKFYHLNKTLLCNKQNIQLFHIFENDWNNKKELIKLRIKEYLEKYDILSDNYIIKENLNKELVNNFLNFWVKEIKDYNNAIGLFENNNLISVICLKNNKIVNYGYSKILKNDLNILLNSIKNINPIQIELDLSFDNINKIKKLNFYEINKTNPKIIFSRNNDFKYDVYDCGNLIFEKKY